ncbi:MAG: threonine/serine exporter family protein [Bacteroidales bacterium]|nr:threonine/serine exporter family protein [Bacteroidales bacterium]
MKENALDVASQAGHIMLENGAEISRVEEVMQRISACYGVSSSNFFVLSNGIFTTGQGYANVEFIPFHGTQLDKVVAVTQLSRDIESGKYTLDEASDELQRIRKLPPHPAWEQIAASAVGSAGFCAIFGGGLIDCAISFLSGILLWCFVLFFSAPNFSKVTANILGGALVTVFCILAHNLGIVHLGNIMIGAIIPLIPGVPFTNGIRDLAAEDYIAGATRLLDALMVFLCIAVGVSITFLVDSHIEGSMIELHGMLTDTFTANWLFQIMAAFFGTSAFAVLFGVPRRYYVACGISGTLGWITYLCLTRLASASAVEATFFATIVVVLSAYVFAYRLKCPVIVFLVCGIFPLVPGAGVFWTSYNIVSDQLAAALQSGFLAMKITVAIVFGIIIVTEVLRRFSKAAKNKDIPEEICK